MIKSSIIVFFISMLPIVELRGAIPVGITLGLSPEWATMLSIFGSTAPIPLILLFIRPLFKCLKRFEFIKTIIDKITFKAMNKSRDIIKYEFLGLLLFVGIPLPGTGSWTGSLIAALLDMRIKIAIPAIFLGNVMAGVIIYILSYTTISIFSFL